MRKEHVHTDLKNIAGAIEQKDLEMLHKAEELRGVLSVIHRSADQGTLESALELLRQILIYFDTHILQHMKIEEDILFPFLESHIPRLKNTIYLLVSEHVDFRKSINNISVLLKNSSQDSSPKNKMKTLEQLHEEGIRIVFMIRHHVEIESKSIHEAVENELKEEEKTVLANKLKNYDH